MRPIAELAGLSLVIALSSACLEPPRVGDGLRSERELPGSEQPGALQGVYAPGLQLRLTVEVPLFADASTWFAESTTPGAVRVSRQGMLGGSNDFSVDVATVAPGRANISVWTDSAREQLVVAAPVEVVVPDAVRLAPAGELAFGAPFEDVVLADGEPIRLVTTEPGEPEVSIFSSGLDQGASFLVELRHQDRALLGGGVLEASPAAGVSAIGASSSWHADENWLVLEAHEAEASGVDLRVGGAVVGRVPVVGVAPDEVARLELSVEPFEGRGDGEVARVIARAFDAEGRRVHARGITWQLGDGALSGFGALARFTIDRTTTSTLAARFGDVSASIEVPTTAVGVSNPDDLPPPTIDCSSTAARGGLLPFTALAAVTLLGRRHRRDARRLSRLR